MSVPQVTVVDYGMGNLLSVRRALEHLGARVELSRSAADLERAERVVLPGVGAFGEGRRELDRLGLVAALERHAASGRPLLGICLGAQLLLDLSHEFGRHPGLGLIPGEVCPIPATGRSGRPIKVPHMGWADLAPVRGSTFDHPLLTGVAPGSALYFVHSFQCRPESPAHRTAGCDYDGETITAMVARDAVVGCQFHPEKSGPVGLQILANFLELAA